MAHSMFLPPPLIRTTRPMHVETMFQDRSRAPSLSSSHRSADSVDSSVASPADNRYDASAKYQELRAMSPAYDQDDDRSSLRSFAASFSFRRPKWALLKKLHRRDQTPEDISSSVQEVAPLPRKSSLSPLSRIHSRQNSSTLSLSPRSPTCTHLEPVQELSSRKCYYSIARNCPGWVLGGSHGDACEACLRAGFFGSP
ncbi:hypothetical protein AMS68_005815 [Peltaster fructicola]|uniref:Uncharacterized protein n=1 Tax=Peltaster fructicola TaxID=286661 RepID=A0A6H0Y0C9_9PEZI|nr:hypothetical protein AMS68_005815 [Peltaster fructicola]